jgi:cytochrome c oxidase cbb3-type subunit 1
MITVPPNHASAEVDGIDASARCPLGLLTAFALLWLVVGGALALLSLLQLHSPGLLADCAWLTYGRLQAVQETVFIYGWAINAGLAAALWLLVRLGGDGLRGANYVILGGVFWNLALVLGLVGIAAGYTTSHPMLQIPRYVQPLMLVAYAAMAVPGVLAWTGRRTVQTYATQWYAVAALFLLPWFFSATQVMLTFLPMRGTLQMVVATWYAQNLISLWLAPVALASAYYLVPKITGRVLPGYDFAIYGFWALLAFGTWMGGRHLIGGPVPAWIATVGIVSSILVLFHHIILFVNLRGVFRPDGSTVLIFVAIGILAYLLSGMVDAIFATHVLAMVTQFTYFQQAQQQLTLGAFSMILFGVLYYMVPRLAGATWPSVALIRAHFLSVLIGFVLLVTSLGMAGWVQGRDLNNAAVTFATIASHTRPWLQLAVVAQALMLLGNLLLAVHCCWLLCARFAPAALSRTAAREVVVS